MSDVPRGPDWWIASDGKWYPPELASDRTVGVPTPTEPDPVPAEPEPVRVDPGRRAAPARPAPVDPTPVVASSAPVEPPPAAPSPTQSPPEPVRAARPARPAEPPTVVPAPVPETPAALPDDEPHDPFAPSPEADAAFARLAASSDREIQLGRELDDEEIDRDDRDDVGFARRPVILGGLAALLIIGLLGVLWWQARSDVSDLEADLASSELIREQLVPRAEAAAAAEDRAEAAEERAVDAEARVAELEAEQAAQTVPPTVDEPEAPGPSVPEAPTLPPTAVASIAVPGGIDQVSVRPGAASTVSAAGLYSVVDVGSNQTIASLPVSGTAHRVLDAADGGIWVADRAGNAIVAVTPGGAIEAARIAFDDPTNLTFVNGSLWASSERGGFLGRIDRATLTIAQQIAVPAPPVGLTAAFGYLWTTTPSTGTLYRVDPTTGEATPVELGGAPDAVSAGLGRLWVVDRDAGVVHSVDPDTLADAREPIVVGAPLTGVVVLGSSVWVTAATPDELIQIDAATGDLVSRTPLGGVLGGLSVGHDSVWVAVPATATLVRVTPPS